ncbi:MAG: 2-hydroxyacyl-CoA dehydratase subunit D [Bacillota bacterium]
MPWLLRSKAAHFLARAITKLSRVDQYSLFQREALCFALLQPAAAYTKARPVVWTSTFVPSELSYAAGAIPFIPELAAGVAASLGLGVPMLCSAEGEGYSSDLCGFHRCMVGMARNGLLPEPNAIVTTNLLCDGGVRAFENLAHTLGVPCYNLDVPVTAPGSTYCTEAVDYVAHQLQDLWQRLVREIHPRRLLNHTDSSLWLSRTAAHSRACTLHRQRVNELRQEVPGPWRGAEALSYFAVEMLAMGCPEGTRFFESLAVCLAKRVASGRAALPGGERFRLLWLHLRPYTDSHVLDHLELNWKALIAFNDYSYVHWQPPRPEAFWQYLAQRMVDHPSWGPAERRVQLVLKLVNDYRVDGVIQFSHWGCRQSTGMAWAIRQALRDEGIPFLELDGDCVDPRCVSTAQQRSRVDAFMEVLEGVKGCRRH